MSSGLSTSMTVVAMVGFALSIVAPATGQSPTSVVKTTAAAKTASVSATLRTPWGDPDLQGNFSNKSEQGTPFERPAEFEGRRVQDVQGSELAEILRQRQERI